MVAWPNATASSRWEPDLKSACVLGFIPVIYYSVLLCVGVPGTVVTRSLTQHLEATAAAG